ncbi:MAG: RhoGAP domain-containing protein, partial [Chlamydiales bacterium]|nr:RhoGAP domain-containing protein [Chlamydiales bacterium]
MSSFPVSFLGSISSAFQNFYEEIFPEEAVVIGKPETFRSGETSLQASLSSYRMSTLALRPLMCPESNQEKLEQCVIAVIGKLLSQHGELLKEEGIFRIPGSQAKIVALKRDLPSDFETDDPHLLTGFLKSVFLTDEKTSGQQIEFLPRRFSREDFDQLTQEIQINPQEAKQQLSFLFSTQSECVKLFILLLQRTSEWEESNKMGIENLALLMNPFLTSHFSLEQQFTCSSNLASFIIQHANEIFPEIVPIFNKLAHPVLKRVEDTIHAAIDMLSANNGELL